MTRTSCGQAKGVNQPTVTVALQRVRHGTLTAGCSSTERAPVGGKDRGHEDDQSDGRAKPAQCWARQDRGDVEAAGCRPRGRDGGRARTAGSGLNADAGEAADDGNSLEVVFTPAAGRAFAALPMQIALAALALLAGDLAEDPHRVGKPLQAPLDDLHSARRGTTGSCTASADGSAPSSTSRWRDWGREVRASVLHRPRAPLYGGVRRHAMLCRQGTARHGTWS